VILFFSHLIKEKKGMRYGTGKYQYELVDGWAKLAEGESFIDIGGISIDRQDRLYILNRSRRPVMVFDCQGNSLRSWGEEHFARAHGICIGPDGSIYCTDDGNHTVTKFDADGNVLMVLGTKNKPSDTGYRRDVPDLFEGISSIARGGLRSIAPLALRYRRSGKSMLRMDMETREYINSAPTVNFCSHGVNRAPGLDSSGSPTPFLLTSGIGSG
jgi:hypothetical protein